MGAEKDYGTIFQIGDILVSEEVITEYFACDYAVCKGKCCIEGDSGAPLEEGEIEEIERNYDKFSGYMSEKGHEAVSAKGFFEIDREGDMVTPVVEGSEECAFCHFDGKGNCLCAIEKAFREGKGRFKKPVSCSLYPIRVTKFPGGGQALNLHRWGICQCAFEKGKKEKIRAYEFLRGPIVENYGEEFYSALEAAAKIFLASS